MPELPEVENLRRGLLKRIRGQKIKKITINKPKLVSGKGNNRRASTKKAREFIRGLRGETIQDIERRAKNLIFHMRSGKILLVHLKMSGQFVYVAKDGKQVFEGGHPIRFDSGHTILPSIAFKRRRVELPAVAHKSELWRAPSEKLLPNKHTHVIFELSKGTLFYNDTRMFGYLLYFPDIQKLLETEHFHNLGLEPFDSHFDLKYFEKELKARKSKLKTVLMDQSIVTGLGNIYCDEVCFAAGVRPTRTAASLKPNEIKKLYITIQHILQKAIKLGGSSVATYRLVDGSRGNYAREHRVYDKAGKPCVICGEDLSKTTINNRTTVYCKHCQK